MQKIRIGIIEDETLIRKNFCLYFENLPDFEFTAGASSVESFLQELPPSSGLDVLMLDIGLPGGMSGLEGIQLLKEHYEPVDIIMWSAYEDSDRIFSALQSGADSYVTKRSSMHTIREAIQTVHNGGSFMSPGIARKVVDFFAPKKKKQPEAHPLTLRQQQIVDGLVKGLSYKMVGHELDISVETVRDHIKKIYKRLHVNSKAEVIRKKLKGEI